MSFQKTILQKGNGLCTPLPGSRCQLKIECGDTPSQEIGFKEEVVDNTCEITLGEWDAAADGILHSCVGSMLEGEVCEITFNLNTEVSVGEKTTTDHDKNAKTKNFTGKITLCSFTKGVELWKMTQEDRLDAASHHKSKGTDLFKNQNVHGAFRRYSLAVKYLISMGKEEYISSELRVKWKTLGTQVYLNMAACQQQSGFHEAVIENCSKALTFDENNVKGYFRRAQSRCKLKDLDGARNDLLHAHKLEANNTAVEKLLKTVESELHARESKMANAMSKMFSS